MTKVSVIQKVNQLLFEAVKLNASDIHFETFENVFKIRFRIDGVLQENCTLPYIQKDEFIARIKIISDLNIAEKRRPQDGKFSFKADNRTIDIRVSIIPTLYNEKVVLRILDRESILFDLSSLGFQQEELSLYRKRIYSPSGMILVTGPTGSGKTTTLYSTLNELNTPEVNITTIEDPIEYNLQGINQSHIRPDIDFTFASALRSILRQDPDIIMLGEIRDLETAEIAIRSALTGHLVLSTLHTNNAVSTITRLINMGVEKFLVSSSVKMIIAQRLVRKICESCKTEYTPNTSILKELELPVDKTYSHGSGCDKCNETGYKGRIAVYEMLDITEKISEMILMNASEIEIRKAAVHQGMKTLKEAARNNVLSGITTPEEIMKIIAV